MSAENNLLVVPLNAIRLDGGTQIRTGIDEAVVTEYAEVLGAGRHLPPLCVFEDDGDYWLADGFHRWHALKKIGRTEALCYGYRGSRRDAQLAAVRANHHHGLRRTNEDKRRAVEIVLSDKEWSQNADRWVAEVCGVSHTFASAVRNQLATVASCQQGGIDVRVGQDGRKRRVPAVNREQAPQPADGTPSAIDAALQTSVNFDACVTRIRDLARSGKKLAGGLGGGYLIPRLADYTHHLESAASLLKEVKPRAPCQTCGGQGCDACQHLGYLSCGLVSSSSSAAVPGCGS